MAKKTSSKIQYRTTEFVVGVLTIGVILAVVIGVYKNNKRSFHEMTKTSEPTQVPTTPQKVKLATTQVLSPTSFPKKTPKLSQIKKLADTSGYQTILIVKGDSYWRIAKRVCGNGKLFLDVQAQNSGKNLQPGDTVIVNCY